MNPYILLLILFLLMIIGHYIIRYYEKKEKEEFDKWKKEHEFIYPLSEYCKECKFYDDIHNMCEHNEIWGDLNEYRIFLCEKNKIKKF